MAYGMLLFAVYHDQLPLVVLHTLMYMQRIDYMPFSDSLQRVRRCSSAMRELDFIKEWLMV